MIFSRNILFALFLLLLSIGLSETYHNVPNKNVLGDVLMGFAFNIFLSVLILSIDAFVKYSLPSNYYSIKGFERNGAIYGMLGIKKAKIIFSYSPAIKFSGKQSDLDGLVESMMLDERHHFLAFIILLIVTVYSMINSRWYFATSLLVFNILLQAYPVMIQRYNRARLINIGLKNNKPRILAKRYQE